MNNRGQVAIFVIIGIIIVAVILLFILIQTDVVPLPGGGGTDYIEGDYVGSIEKCIEEDKDIDSKINNITAQGGSYEPEFYYDKGGEKYEYLCYIGGYYETCVMQQPVLMGHIENEIEEQIKRDVRNCVKEVSEEFEEEGYNVNRGSVEFDFEFITDNRVFRINPSVSLSKDGSRESYREEIEIRKQSKMYNLISLSTSILNEESIRGDTDPLSYMVAYPEIRIEKKKQGDGTTLYFLKNINSGEEFNFAVRSLAWPPGYGWEI